jgi:hypothetical protein
MDLTLIDECPYDELLQKGRARGIEEYIKKGRKVNDHCKRGVCFHCGNNNKSTPLYRELGLNRMTSFVEA